MEFKYYQAYTQNATGEKFWIEDDDQENLIVSAESAEEAAEIFEKYLYETSLYSDEETAAWIKQNPIHVVEINEEEELT